MIAHRLPQRFIFAAALMLAAICAPSLADAREAPSIAAVRLAELPKEAQETYRLIRKGGPFPYSKDGVTFGNREKRLPAKPRGYYHEYTVPTPGAGNRGARRIVCGADTCYYSDDHYTTFRLIQE